MRDMRPADLVAPRSQPRKTGHDLGVRALQPEPVHGLAGDWLAARPLPGLRLLDRGRAGAERRRRRNQVGVLDVRLAIRHRAGPLPHMQRSHRRLALAPEPDTALDMPGLWDDAEHFSLFCPIGWGRRVRNSLATLTAVV